MTIELGKEYKFHNGQCRVFEDRVEIARKGFFGHEAQGSVGIKTIPIAEIITVQLKPASFWANGVLQFSVLGDERPGSTLRKAAYDVNAFVLFGKADCEQNQAAECIREYVLKRSAELRGRTPKSATTQVASPTDEIRKYKALLDEGIITQEEFEKKKKELLGL